MIFICILTCNFGCVASMLVKSVNMLDPARKRLVHLQLNLVYLGCNLERKGYSLYLMDYRLAMLANRPDLLLRFLALPMTYMTVTRGLKMFT